MTVYRVQDAEGRGPWRPGFSHQWVEERPGLDKLLPAFQEFPTALRRALPGCSLGIACVTPQQLRLWFSPGEYRRLLAFGYRAVKLEAGRVLDQSKTQCMIECVKPLAALGEPFDLYPA